MKKSTKILLAVSSVAILVVAVLVVGLILAKGAPKTPSQKGPDKSQVSAAARKEKQTALLEEISQIFQQISPGSSYSLGVYDVKNNEYFGFNDTVSLHAASVSKVLTATMLLDKVEKGEMALSDPMGAYNVEFQLEKMINISNQDSWDLIDEALGKKPQDEFAVNTLGMSSAVNMIDNKMAVKDVSILLTKLAEGQVLSESSRQRLFGYMQKTESEDFFSPAFVEAALPFYHKTGKYLGEGHDAAIVLGKNPFVLVLFTENNTSPDLLSRGEVMRSVARSVATYFQSL